MDRTVIATAWRCPWPLLVMLAGLGWLVGCRAEVTRIDLTTFDRSGGRPEHYCTKFARASYRLAPGGTLELVLRSEKPSRRDPTQTITEIFYLKEFWNPRPGTTYADATQINARVQYAILSPPTGVRYDGGAFIIYKVNKRTGQITGRIESGHLRPRYRMGDALEPFGPATLTGTFQASENPGDVVNTIQLLDSQFRKRAEN